MIDNVKARAKLLHVLYLGLIPIVLLSPFILTEAY